MIIFKTPTVTIEYDKEKSQLIQKWKGFSSSDVFRTAIMKTMEFSRSNSVKSLISDTLEQSVVKAEDIEFAASRMPQAAFGNLKAIAFIMPKNVFTQLSVKKFEDQSHVNMIRFFDSYESAQAWIASVVE